MVGFLCLFFPPVIAVVITARIRKEEFRYEQYIAYYAVFAVIINGIMFWALSFMFRPHSISAPDVFTTSFSARYLLFASIIALVSANVLESLRKRKPKPKDISQDDEAELRTDKDE